ncbi:hypothetical protein [Seonamhaeicola marinus]|uniref:Uncharacterized protein n=1 Tax=Seonamhaeicola marinus TaxID=1912246 RepID=A0A5D0HRG1_9FLAO|nr:hypothetical protein [Seonamhaeicola marinus]TYA71972.1 hypothetical protein FUA24_20705 [Seonamhaeicola marinus]
MNKTLSYTIIILLMLFTFSVKAQIDSERRSISIPAVASKKDSLDNTSSKSPSAKIKSNIDFKKLDAANKKKEPLKALPKKELSMFKEEFGNPGELYTDRIKKQENSIKNKLELGTIGSKVDVFFGDHKTKSKYVRVMYRDYGLEDGDIVRVSVNDEVIVYRAGLSNAFSGFKIELKPGVNKIEFLALNEGYALPNTAHFRIVGENKELIASDLWALSINVKGTINIIRE